MDSCDLRFAEVSLYGDTEVECKKSVTTVLY